MARWAIALLLLITYATAAEPRLGLDQAASPQPSAAKAMRPLPTQSKRPLGEGPFRWVDADRGDDANDGSADSPWKTLQHAGAQLKPGDTLILKGGGYFQTCKLSLVGTAEKPITIRSAPGELAILDGGSPEFVRDPSQNWEPVTNGAPVEYRSTREYPELAGEARRDVNVFGNFADTMIPLHGYRFEIDFRATNPYWNIGNKLNTEQGVYCGPGVWFNPQTKRVHVRLAPLPKGYPVAYTGPSDPRKLPLVIAGPRTPLELVNARHIHLRDIAIRGSTVDTVRIANCRDISFDNVTIYGGSPALQIDGTERLKLIGCAVRGLSAPWSSRASHKYRGKSPYLLICGQGNREFEFAYSEFTDNHDGIFIGTVRKLDFHHNLVEGFDDDGVYLNSRGTGGEIRIYQNRFARTLSAFAYSGSEPTGGGVYIYRNVFDMREPTFGQPPADAQAATPGLRPSRVWGEHGSPTWEPMYIYHNTVLTADAGFRNYYAAGWSSHTRGTRRRIFNNIFLQLAGNPGLVFLVGADDDLQVDGNLLWGVQAGPEFNGDYFAKFRKSKVFAASKRHYPPGWGSSDRFGDPLLQSLQPLDARLQEDSAALDAGIALPADWPDPLRAQDQGKPDIGAFPRGARPWHVGPRAR